MLPTTMALRAAGANIKRRLKTRQNAGNRRKEGGWLAFMLPYCGSQTLNVELLTFNGKSTEWQAFVQLFLPLFAGASAADVGPGHAVNGFGDGLGDHGHHIA
jgi:hypothetical protein